MTEWTDASAGAIVEQLRELFSNLLALNLLGVYWLQNEKRGHWHPHPAIASIPESTQKQPKAELALLELFLSV